MTTIQENRRYFHAVMYFVIACLLLALLTSCSPAAPGSVSTATPSATITATALSVQSVQTATPPPPSCTVTGYLNFRTAPSKSAAVIRVLIAGETVTIKSRGDWMNVLTRDNKAGFIYGKYCQE